MANKGIMLALFPGLHTQLLSLKAGRGGLGTRLDYAPNSPAVLLSQTVSVPVRSSSLQLACPETANIG